MKKIKMLYNFTKKADRPLVVFLEIFWVYCQIPAIILHEGLHLLTAFILRAKCKFDKDDSYFLKYEQGNPGLESLATYRISFSIAENPPWKRAIIAQVPWIGSLLYLIAIILSIFYAPTPTIASLVAVVMVLYFAYVPQGFKPSDEDDACYNTAMSEIKEIKKTKNKK